MQWAAVAGGEELPVLEVRDRSLDGGAQGADGLVEDLVGCGSFLAWWLALAGDEAGADVAEVTYRLAVGEQGGEARITPGASVVPGTRHRGRDREKSALQSGGDLQVEPGVAVLAAEELGTRSAQSQVVTSVPSTSTTLPLLASAGAPISLVKVDGCWFGRLERCACAC